MTPVQWLIWEDRAVNLGKAMFLLVNLKNEIAKKDLRLAYTQGNH